MKHKGKKIFVLGYFGFRSGKLEGQTAKTRNVYNMLERRLDTQDSLTCYDTEEFRSNPFSIFTLLYKTVTCRTLVILPCKNNIKVIFPVVFCLSYIFRFKIVHIAIGSWHVEFLRKHKMLRLMSGRIKAFLSEVNMVDEELRAEFGFTNGGIFPNFRINEYIPDIRKNGDSPLRLVFMSRIHRMKGLEMVFNIAKHVENNYPEGTVTIDFYGPVETDDAVFFHGNVNAHKSVRYLGVLEQKDIYATLNDYDILLLPTRYTEGFPGAILDAYISGIPVLVSEWKFAREFVDDGKTGYICNMDDTHAFCNVIDTLYSDRELLGKLKRTARERSLIYSEDYVWDNFKQYL